MIQTQTNPRLRVGLLVDNHTVNAYIKEFIFWAMGQDDIHLICIVERMVGAHGGKIFKQNYGRVADRLFYSLVVLFEKIVAHSKITAEHSIYADHFRGFDVRDMGIETISITVLPSRSADSHRYADGDIGRIKQLGFDLLIHCGLGALEDAALMAGKFGVITLHYQYTGVDKCAPPGFWATYYGQNDSECCIVKVGSGHAGTQVLMRGRFTTKLTYLLNQASLYLKTYYHLRRLLIALIKKNGMAPGQSGVELSEGDALAEVSDYSFPKWHESSLYLCKTFVRIISRSSSNLLKVRERWTISIISADWTKAELTSSSALRPPKGRFWADPFLFKYQERIFCFVEEFTYKTNIGHIAVLEIDKGNVIEYGPILVDNFHLSFPYVFEYCGNVFMCPECSATQSIRLYRCIDFPNKWKLEKIVMQNVFAADTMIFPKNDKWWMLTNIDYSGVGDYTAELYLFYAESPMSEAWTEHPQNPIKISCQGARNGGLILQGTDIYRVGQRQGFGQYGKGISVYEIAVLNENSYQERLVREIEPNFRKGLRGAHHLSSVAGMTAIDHASREFVG